MKYIPRPRADRTQEAIDLLKQVAAEHGVDVATIRGKGKHSRFPEYVRVRAEFCKRGVALKITVMELGIALNRDHTTVTYHANKNVQGRKRKPSREWTQTKAERRRELRRLARESIENSTNRGSGCTASA